MFAEQSLGRVWRSFILILVGIRLLVLMLRSFLPLNFPDVWRQTDTLGVALRYWLRWTNELPLLPGKVPSWLGHLIPAVLNSGDTPGVSPMEFPILNWIFAPCFSLPAPFGVYSAIFLSLLCLAGLFGVGFWQWRGLTSYGLPLRWVFPMFPIVSLGVSWSGKFMPDSFSVVLFFLGMGALMNGVMNLTQKSQENYWSRSLWLKMTPVVLFTMSLLMKPTSIAGLFFILLIDQSRFDWKKTGLAVALSLIPAIAIVLIYYKGVVPGLAHFAAHPTYYAVYLSSPLDNVGTLWRSWSLVLNFFEYRIFCPGFIFVLIGWMTFRLMGIARGDINGAQRIKELAFLAGIVLLQFIFLITLSGEHGLKHPYYYLSLCPSAIVLGMSLLRDCVGRIGVVLRGVVVISLIVGVIEMSAMDLKPWLAKIRAHDLGPFWTAMSQCAALKDRNPSLGWNLSRPFRSTPEQYPGLGLCFAERVESMQSEIGFFWLDQPIPRDCQEIDRAELIGVFRCKP